MSDAAGRVLALDGIHNFRDYGGYAAAGGARVRQATLWRSGQHCHATAADLAAVARLGLRTVIDLRGDSERQAYPCLRPADFAAAVLFAPGETSARKASAAHEEAAAAIRTADDAHAALVRVYRGLEQKQVLAP